MFEINFRVTQYLDEMKMTSLAELNREFCSIYGFFQIKVGKESEGYYHQNPIQEWEYMAEIIDCWMESLLKMVLLFGEKDGCVLVPELECEGIWFSFEKKGSEMSISHIVLHTNQVETRFLNEDEVFEKVFWSENHLQWEQVRNEVLSKSKKLLDEMGQLNPLLLKSEALYRIAALVNTLG